MSQEFLPGQRWVSSANPQMGLGVVMSADTRTVSVMFPAVGETRIYAKESAPMMRVRFGPGDIVLSNANLALQVDSVVESNGLFVYAGLDESGQSVELPEGDLNHFLQLNRPTDRLFYGDIDQDKWFQLRYQTLTRRDRLANDELYGLTGCRTQLLPHQMYVAWKVARRYAPRVLLADEVGLGKTIEAGLILHYQLLTERASRVLIVVPESLVHQWLVEMLRRFNLQFSVFDQERCLALEQSSGQENPFHTSQLVLCSLNFLTKNPHRFSQALEGDWDLLVVDEAHHLQWSPEQPSHEYSLIESLAGRIRGVLLLTGTPEQLGKTGHFARLRLLDSNRFPDFEEFIREEKTYQPVARVVEALLNENTRYKDVVKELGEVLGTDRELSQKFSNPESRQNLISQLLDRHGTGRVLFRNTRMSITGFPERAVLGFPLLMPPQYLEVTDRGHSTKYQINPSILLTPERLYETYKDAAEQPWTKIDPRVPWLVDKLKAHKQHKLLVIAAKMDTVLELTEALRVHWGIQAAVFHEQMSLVERDRAAAFFADEENGSQVLICSEIGSEGRNFQFSHHLILFDLPLDPDLLEQRIGRLDRIGQRQTINILAPYLENSAQAIMYQWYDQGLDAFAKTCPAGQSIFKHLGAELINHLFNPSDKEKLHGLIEETKSMHSSFNEALKLGRDRLLEHNSCQPEAAQALVEKARFQDLETDLADYMDTAFDCFGVNAEIHSKNALILEPGEHMHISFPGLTEDAMTITFDRGKALENEDMQFFTWEHPSVTGIMEAVTSSELGNCSLIGVKIGGLKPGNLFVECVYVFESAAIGNLQTGRYLPPTSIRLLVNEQAHEVSDKLTFEKIQRTKKPLSKEIAGKVIKLKEKSLRTLIPAVNALADGKAQSILAQAQQKTENTLMTEIDRLIALQQINPNVRDEEIEFFRSELHTLKQVISRANVRLDAVRVLVAT